MPEITKETIGANIKARREHIRLTQAEAAAAAGMLLSSYKQLENAYNEQKATSLVRIARALRTTVSYLVGEVTESEMITEDALRAYRSLPSDSQEIARAVIDVLARQK